MTLGEERAIVEEWTALPSPPRAAALLLRLTVSLTLAMTAFAVLTPVVPRRLEEIGAGVQALGVLLGVTALAQLIAAPAMGALADRRGRRPVLLVALTAYAVVTVVFLAAASLGPYLVVRAAEGVLTAGLFPATAAVVSDLLPAQRRARWVGIVTAAYAIGFVIGPPVGGAAYDLGGSTAALGFAAALAIAGLLVGATVPETRRPAAVREPHRRPPLRMPPPALRPLFAIDFLVLFAFGFIAPQLVFFAYDDAGLTTTQYGLVVALSALAMATGQTVLGGLSERLGRRTVVGGALVAYAGSFALYVPFHTALAIALIAALAGLAFGVLAPALTMAYLDGADPAERSSVLGTRNAVMSAGAFAGPLLLAIVRSWTTPTTVFVATSLGLLVPALLAVRALPRTTSSSDAHDRTPIANATVLGVLALVDSTVQPPSRAAGRSPHAAT